MKYYAVYFCKNQWLSVFHVLKFALCTSPTIKPNCNLVSNAWASYMASILIVSRWVCKSTRTLRLHPTTSPHDPNTKQGAPRMQLQRHEIHWNPYFPYILLIFVVSLCFWRFFCWFRIFLQLTRSVRSAELCSQLPNRRRSRHSDRFFGP